MITQTQTETLYNDGLDRLQKKSNSETGLIKTSLVSGKKKLDMTELYLNPNLHILI
jgi:hypothetical protein